MLAVLIWKVKEKSGNSKIFNLIIILNYLHLKLVLLLNFKIILLQFTLNMFTSLFKKKRRKSIENISLLLLLLNKIF